MSPNCRARRVFPEAAHIALRTVFGIPHAVDVPNHEVYEVYVSIGQHVYSATIGIGIQVVCPAG